MANISLSLMNQNYFGTSTSGVGSLFGSLGTGSSGSQGGSLTSLLSEYNSIKSGSYGKLLRTYYGGNRVDYDYSAKKNSNTNNKASEAKKEDSNSQLASTRDAAKELKESVSKLTTTGKDSLFNKKEIKQEDGTTKEDYDTDGIYKAVSEFVKDYNSMIDAADKSNTFSIASKANGMTSLTRAMSKSLAKVGITVGVDDKLSIDEKKFKDAELYKVKSLFNGSTSYAAQIGTSASGIANTSSSKLAQLNGSMYNNYGSYGSSYAYSGSLYASRF